MDIRGVLTLPQLVNGCFSCADLVQECSAYQAGRGEGAPKLDEGLRGVPHLPRRRDAVHPWGVALHRFHPESRVQSSSTSSSLHCSSSSSTPLAMTVFAAVREEHFVGEAHPRGARCRLRGGQLRRLPLREGCPHDVLRSQGRARGAGPVRPGERDPSDLRRDGLPAPPLPQPSLRSHSLRTLPRSMARRRSVFSLPFPLPPSPFPSLLRTKTLQVASSFWS